MAFNIKLASSLFLIIAILILWPSQTCSLDDHPFAADASYSRSWNFSSDEFKDIDLHAINAPDSVKGSIKSLASYLTKPAKNDREKTRAIFRWIAENIDYDVLGFFEGINEESTPEGVLKSGKSVCSGYSNLFETLANASGLETVTISGHAKGYNYTPGVKFSGPTNHAWNAVKLDGKWQLIDSTWGAGHLEDGKYVREFDDHYFLTPPEEFIYDHFPEDQKWQLLDKPLSKKEFEDLVYLKSAFFSLGFKLANQSDIIFSNGRANVILSAPKDVYITAELKILNESLTSKKAYGSPVLIRRDKEQYIIELLPPSPGDYILRIFGRAGNEEGSYEEILEYKVVESSGSKMSFPIVFSKFFDLGMRMNNLTNGTIEAKGRANLSISAPPNILMIASLKKLDVSGNPFNEEKSSIFLQHSPTASYYDIEILLPTPGEYILTVFAKRKDDPNSYQGILQYNVTASSGSDIVFPEVFRDFHENGAYLYSPMIGNLKAGLNQTFKLLIPGAEHAAVISGKDWHQLSKNGDLFQGEVAVGKSDIEVGAKYSGTDKYRILLKYSGI